MTIVSDNVLLDALPPAEREKIAPRLEAVALELGASIDEANVPISHVHFPTSGIISMVSVSDEGTVEVGTVGREGMAGIPVLLQAEAMATRAFVQVRGASLRMPASDFQQTMSDAGALQKAGLIRYRRGVITVLDRDGLESASCACYRIARASMDRLVGTGAA